MLKSIAGTFLTRVVSSLSSLLILLIVSRWLGGTVALGTVALLNLAITVGLLLPQFVAGTSLVYFASRSPLKVLLPPAYLWAAASIAVMSVVFYFFPILYPEGYYAPVIIIMSMEAFFAAHLSIIMGREKIGTFNKLQIIQALTTLIALSLFIVFSSIRNPHIYVFALYLSYGTMLVLSGLALFRLSPVEEQVPAKEVRTKLFTYGFWAQLANTLQLGNYRLVYYLIEAFAGRIAVGIYATSTQLTEGVWLIGRSLSVVQYARISNSRDEKERLYITLTLFKISVILSIGLWLILIAIPASFFQTLFKADLAQVHTVIMWLGPGILAASGGFIITHYFSGTARYHLNTYSTGIGITITLILGFWLVPKWGLAGGAFTVVMTYLAQLIFQITAFKMLTHFKWRDLYPDMEDFRRGKNILKKYLNKKSPKRQEPTLGETDL